MNKIHIEGLNGHVEISLRHEAEEINDVLQDLIVPALKAYGFAPETIQNGFTEYCEDFSEECVPGVVNVSNVDWPVIDELVQGMRDAHLAFTGKDVNDRVMTEETHDAEEDNSCPFCGNVDCTCDDDTCSDCGEHVDDCTCDEIQTSDSEETVEETRVVQSFDGWNTNGLNDNVWKA